MNNKKKRIKRINPLVIMCLLQQNNNSSTNNNNNKRRKKNKREKDNVICVDFQKKIKVSVKAPVSVKRRNREREE